MRTYNTKHHSRFQCPPMQEDFIGGAIGSAGAGVLGSEGWSWINGTAPTFQQAVANHPGIIRMDTSATANTVQALYLYGNGSGALLMDMLWDLTFIVRLVQNDTDTLVRLGVQGSATGDSSANGVYFEKAFADTNWQRVTQAGGVRTKQASVACDTNYHRFRVRRINATAVGFTVDGTEDLAGGEVVIADANVPGAVIGQPFIHIKNQTAASKLLDVDFVEFGLIGLSR